MARKTVKEITADAIKLTLAAADVSDESAPANYTKITARNEIKDTDYLSNLTWVGRLSGSNDPVIIVVKNALATNGLTISFADKSINFNKCFILLLLPLKFISLFSTFPKGYSGQATNALYVSL